MPSRPPFSANININEETICNGSARSSRKRRNCPAPRLGFLNSTEYSRSLLVREHLLSVLPSNVKIAVRERHPKDCDEASQFAENYLQAGSTSIIVRRKKFPRCGRHRHWARDCHNYGKAKAATHHSRQSRTTAPERPDRLSRIFRRLDALTVMRRSTIPPVAICYLWEGRSPEANLLECCLTHISLWGHLLVRTLDLVCISGITPLCQFRTCDYPKVGTDVVPVLWELEVFR